MVIKADLDQVFDEASGGRIEISEDAPEVLKQAVEDAKSDLDSETEWVLRAVGAQRRSLEFGLSELTTIQCLSVTVFVGRTEKGVKILAVAVSHSGPLTSEQVDDALQQLGDDVKLSPDEIAQTSETSLALRSIKQARYIVIYNANSLVEKVAEAKVLLDNVLENEPDVLTVFDELEVYLHNLLSSVYTFIETVEQSLRSLDILIETKHLIQKYKDEISTAIGLRHCIQHNTTLPVRWLAKYSHQEKVFSYNIGVPITRVNDPEYYHGKPTDASGQKYTPTEYYYKDVDSYIIDIDKLARSVREATDTQYRTIQEKMEDDGLEGAEILKKFFRMKSRSMIDDIP